MFAGFMMSTWIVATMVAAVAGFVGFFVVIRRSSFAAHTLPMAAFPGAAAANLLGVNELLGLVAFAGLGVLGISQLGRRDRHEVATALCLVTLLALGTLFLSMTREYSQGVYALLFGEVLGISRNQILPVAVMSMMAIATTGLFFRPLLLDSISAEIATAGGVSSRLMELQFLTVLALCTAMALPVVGALLVFSLMVGPASAARSLTDRPLVAALLSSCISVVTVWVAIALAYLSNWPVGFFVGALGVGSYLSGRMCRGRGRTAMAVAILLAGIAQAAHYHKDKQGNFGGTDPHCLLCQYAGGTAALPVLPTVPAALPPYRDTGSL